MKRALLLAPVMLLAACSSPLQWHVVGVYTDPDAPVARNTGGAYVTFSGSSFSGTTGCAEVSGEFEGDDTVRLHDVTVGDPGDCAGWARHMHDQLAPLLHDDTEFTVTRPTDTDLVLTLLSDAVDAPAVKLRTW